MQEPFSRRIVGWSIRLVVKELELVEPSWIGNHIRRVNKLVNGTQVRWQSLHLLVRDRGVDGIGKPTIHVGPHPAVFYAAYLANALRPNVQYASIVGSFGWNSKAVEQIAGLIPTSRSNCWNR